MEVDDIAEVQRLLSLEPDLKNLCLDLGNLTLVDRECLGFLATCEQRNIRLKNCPGYIREWIGKEPQ